MRDGRCSTIAVLLLALGCAGERATEDELDPVASDAKALYGIYTTVLESPDGSTGLCLGVLESFPPQCPSRIDVTGLEWTDVPWAESAQGTTWASGWFEGWYDGATFVLSARPLDAAGPQFEPRDESELRPACDSPQGVGSRPGEGRGAADADDARALDQRRIRDLVALWLTDASDASTGELVVSAIVRPGAQSAATEQIRGSYDGPLCVVERDMLTLAELDQLHDDILVELGELGMVDEFPISWVEPTMGHVVLQAIVATDRRQAWAEANWGEQVELRSLLTPL